MFYFVVSYCVWVLFYVVVIIKCDVLFMCFDVIVELLVLVVILVI